MQAALPDVFLFQDYRAFLKQAIAAKKQASRGFGLRRLAEKSGFKSPAMLSMIVSGQRNLTPGSAEKLAVALQLGGRRKQYLVALAALGMAKTLPEQAQAQSRLLQLKSWSEENTLTAKQYRALANWHYSAIYNLLSTPGPHDSVERIAKRMRKAVSVSQVREALADLEAIGLVAREGAGWVAGSGALTTPEDIRDLAIRKYHHNMIGLAQEALELPLEEREMNGLTIAVSQDDLPWIKERIRGFRRSLNEELSARPKTREVYQLNIQFFPLTRPGGSTP